MRYGMEYEEVHENMHMHRPEKKFKLHKIAVGAGKSRQHRAPTTFSSSGDISMKKSKTQRSLLYYKAMEDDEPQLPCADKLIFNTQKDALATATVAHYRYGGKVKPYKCNHCGLWHLASDYQ